MVTAPADTPVTMPVEPTVAIEVDAELHVPPVGPEVSAVVSPVHTVAVPVITSGNGLTVTTAVLIQPVLMVYVIVVVPVVIPVNKPAVVPMVATVGSLLVQETPVGAQLSTVVDPVQILVIPVIADGNGLTVTVLVAATPQPVLYVITVIPAPTPVTTPKLLMVATLVLPVLHNPPGVVLLKAVVKPAHIIAVPVITDGTELTVTGAVVIQPVDKV